MKIALVTYAFDQGGTNRVLCHLANGFLGAGHEVDLLLCTSAGSLHREFCALLRPGVRVHALSDTRWLSRGIGQLRVFAAFRRWIGRHRPDALLGTGNNISWFTGLGALAAARPRPPYYLKTTNPIVRDRGNPLAGLARRLVYGLLFRRSAGVLTLSDAETRALKARFPAAADKFETVYNAYLTPDFAERSAQAAPRAPHDRIVLLAAGRLEKQKNFDRLLRAFAAADPHNAILRIAGEGRERAALTRLAQQLGIADRVELAGYTPDIAGAMANADLFVLSSDYEGLPAVVIEALASNLPVVSTDCFANARDLLDDLPGCAVTERSTEGLATALRTWLAHPRFGLALRPHAMLYSIDSAVQSHLRAIEDAVPDARLAGALA